MTRLLQLFRLGVVRQFLSWSGAWWFVVALAAGQILPPLIGLAVWRTVFPGSAQVSTYYLALLFTVATTASYENHTFSQGIYKGTLADELVKPQPVIMLPLSENVAVRAWIGLVAVPVIVLVGAMLTVPFEPGALLVALPFWLGAGLLRFLFTWCLAMTAFWSERVHAITAFGTTTLYLLGGNAVPINLLPSFWGDLARLLPFYSMLGLPADAAAGQAVQAGTAAIVQIGWLVLLGLAARTLWLRGLRRFTAVGG
ncbi:ABC transporter permease [Actinoplanes cyaneus]|uniref:ABC transporter permease n=1 Tax=Actinoplanes cyaneus TaxID=52696 RepID=A0A919IZL1_9ACTN|nr:ABC-2 family transporter protein [Actinoplanes cyaneus]MCW2144267.1 ABC-2 type transport system permease protein [Actinoplanes cyaneus]GID71020.1 ABC transporter permease [Actinoplanes cyaneus]